MEGAGDLLDDRHAAEFLGRAHLHIEPGLREHTAELLGFMRVARGQVDIHGGNVSTKGWEGKKGRTLG